MMAEKGDLGLSSESVSLPPNYAPSEAFTDSPPPAYQRKNAPIVRVARMICVTAFAITFLIGFFIVAHKWVTTSHKASMQEQFVYNDNLEVNIPEELNDRPSKLVQEALVSLELDNKRIENDITGKENEIEEFLDHGEQVVQPLVETSTEGQEDEELIDMQELPEEPQPMMNPFQNPFESINKMNLPFGDIFNMENNPNCRMKKRNRNIGPGIMSSTISIICDGEDEEGDDRDSPMLPPPMLPPGARRVEPPMDLLNTILKVLSSGSDLSPLDGPRMIKMIPMGSDSPMIPPMPIRGQSFGIPPPISGDHQNPTGFPFKMNMIPFGRIQLRPREHEGPQNEDRSQLPPMFKRMPFPGPFPFPRGGDDQFPPMMQQSFPPNVKIIRMQKPMQNIEEERHMHQPHSFPLNMHQIMKLMPSRKARIIRINPQMNQENRMNGSPFPFGFPNEILFPQQNGEGPLPHPMPEASGRALPDPVALPGVKLLRLPFSPRFQRFPMDPSMTHMELREMPSKSFINQNDIKLSPFQRVNIPEFDERPHFQSFNHHDDSHFPFTPHHNHDHHNHNHQDHGHYDHSHDHGYNHIEEPEYYNNEPENYNNEPEDYNNEPEDYNNEPEDYNDEPESFFNGPFDQDVEEFGPPRTHTLMQAAKPVFAVRDHHQEPAQNNIHEEDKNFHTHADGVSHTHPHNGPHTHIGGEIFPLNINFPPQNLDSNFHTHENGVSHSHNHEMPHTHNGDEMIPLNFDFPSQEVDPNFHNHDNGVSHSHAFDGPHTHNGDEMIPLNFDFPSQEGDPNFHNHDNGVSHSHAFDGPHTHVGDEIIPMDFFPRQEMNPTFPTQDDGVSHDESNTYNDDFFITEPVDIDQNVPEEDQTFLIDDTPSMNDDLPVENFDQSVFQSEPQEEQLFFQLQPHVQTEQELTDTQSDYLPLEPDFEIQPDTFVPHLPEDVHVEPEVASPVEDALTQYIADVIDVRGLVPDVPEEMEPLPEIREYAPEGRFAPNPPPVEENAELLTSDGSNLDDQIILIK